MKRTEQPLQVAVERGQLVIRIGLNVLAHAAEHCPRLPHGDEYWSGPLAKIDDRNELANDVVCALLDEREDGSSPISDAIDAAILEAYEQGSIGFTEESFTRTAKK